MWGLLVLGSQCIEPAAPAIVTALMTTQTVINCLMTLFFMFGLLGFVHGKHSFCFSAKVFKDFFIFVKSQQAEEHLYIQQVIRKTNAGTKQFGEQSNLCCIAEDFYMNLQGALYSTGSFLYPSKKLTPHDRIFQFHRRSMLGKFIPTWLLNPGPVFFKFCKKKRKSFMLRSRAHREQFISYLLQRWQRMHSFNKRSCSQTL